MPNFNDMKVLYDEYIKEKKYNLNQFYNIYNGLDDTSKEMLDFILSKQEFYCK